MKRLGVVLVLLVVVAGLWWSRKSHKGPSVAERRAAGHAIEPATLPMRQTPVRIDREPEGTLRLEGQVIDGEERPVIGAEVALEGSGRVARSAEDGSFVFDKLIARAYRLEARTDEGHAGPVEARLTKSSDPVILRLRRGGTLEVEVRDGEGKPVSGAEVELRSSLSWRARSDDKGHAALRGIGPGWPVLHVVANGFAPWAMMLRTSGDAARPQKQLVTLSHGAGASGTVVDGSGKPVSGARVIAIATAEPFPVIDPDRDAVISGADGGWRFVALSAGSWRFVAYSDAHAPATTPPIPLDGERDRERIEIRFGDSATLRGLVVDDQQQPIGGARVRVARVGAVVFGVERETRSDDSGRFVIAALPVGPVEVSASVEEESSAVLRLVLEHVHEINLQMTLRGSISGVAVGADGKPVGEARVLCEPTWTGALGEQESWLARGVPEAIADGDGKFRFAGLPDGSYQLRGVRPGGSEEALWSEKGTEATVGTRDLRLVVHGEGRVKGRVQKKAGGAPEVFSVEAGAARPEPFSLTDGAFELDAPAGVRELIVTGPSFQRASKPGVRIEEGKTIDVGVIVVEAGRSVSGRVVDGSGRPVADAEVAGGLLLTGDGGARLDIPSEGFRVQETRSDASGRYVLNGFGEHPITLVAGKAGVGRATPVKLPRGTASAEVDLPLGPTGSLTGTITRDGQPVADAVVIANPRSSASSSNFFVTTGADGGYVFDTLSAGEWVVAPMLGGGGMRPKDMFFKAVTVEAGKQARGDISAPRGPGSVEIRVLDDKGAPVPLAQVLMVGGTLDAGSTDPMDALATVPSGTLLPIYYRMAVGAPVRIEHLDPGTHYTICGIPLPADPNDPSSMSAVRDILYKLPSACAPFTSTSADQKLELRGTDLRGTRSPQPSK